MSKFCSEIATCLCSGKNTQAPFNFKCRLTGTAISSKISLFGIRKPFHYLSDDEEAAIVGTAQSSNLGPETAPPGTAPRLIDGKGLDGIWHNENGCAATSNNAASIEWFSLELQVSQKIARVQIANRLDCPGCLERGRNIRITIGPSRVYDPNEPLCLPEINELVVEPGLQDYVCTGELHEGKFVKISRPGQLNLCEVKVFTHQGKCIDVSENNKFIF